MTGDVVKPTNNMDEQSNEVVNSPVTEDTVVEETQPEVQVQGTQAGDKTPSHLLLKSLQAEREKNKQLENKLSEFATLSDEETFSDEGRALQKEIQSLRSELTDVRGELTKKDLVISHPVLKEKWEEFEEFRQDPENSGMSLKTAAKAYLAENGLLGTTRKGLEKQTGGTRTPPQSTPSAEDIKTLRETNFKKYSDMLSKGQIKV